VCARVARARARPPLPPAPQTRRLRAASDALVLKSVTDWHERAETRPGANAKAESAAFEAMEADLKAAAEELVKVRRARLRELYAAERAGWAAELAARGLAMATANEWARRGGAGARGRARAAGARAL